MIWTIIILIVGIILIKFFIALNKQSNDNKKQGGMRVKYSELIDFFYSFDPKMKIVKETSTFITVKGSGMNGKMSFDIHHTFNSVLIYWTKQNIFGNNERLKWEFNTNISQENMIGQITIDLMQNLLKNFANEIEPTYSKPKQESIEFAQKEMEEAFDSLVKKTLKDNQMEFSATVGMLVLSAVGNAAKYFKEQYKLEKDKICMTDKEIDNLVDEVSTRVLQKYLE